MHYHRWTMREDVPYLIVHFLFHGISVTGSIRSKIAHSRSCQVLSPGFTYLNQILLYICLFINNWFRLGLIHVLPVFTSMASPLGMYICFMQGFLFHVCSLFYISIVLFVRLYWHYCSLSDESSGKFQLRRLIPIPLCSLAGSCLFTFPSFSQEWTSMAFDPILKICVIDYTFTTTYICFIIVIAYTVPFLLMIVSHHMQLKTMDAMRRRVKWSSLSMLLWYLFNILVIIS